MTKQYSKKLKMENFHSKEHLRNCIKITGNTAELLSNFIRDKRL
ncbi:hypothetical protein SPSIL_034930 [Sporomusa silvacetica DSM 10669]|uniref:Uncharacterized protein n=1 Tax=Sporomusa silvacetica DSM 10669 TaxID=1123289 RepID=A0ABZ3IPD5_9FIRM|nr:hypothetical protein [Sporomusa silvacetica]OZC19229.1 hypothetical protein SPSIL_21840 [Sporomusa silvacetica DSM 10669]